MHMKNIISPLLIIAIGLLAGCAWLDFDGDGNIDPAKYLSNADITVTWVDAEGNAYQVDPMQIGAELVYNYVEVKTGYRFELAPQQDGTIGIWVKDPKGQEIWIIPGPIAPPPSAPPVQDWEK